MRENPYVSAVVSHPETNDHWALDLQYDRSETDGPVFDEMDMKLEAIASMTGMIDVFKLRAADIYQAHAVTRLKARAES